MRPRGNNNAPLSPSPYTTLSRAFPRGVTYYPARWNANCRSSAAELRKRLFLRETYFSLSPASPRIPARSRRDSKKWPRKAPSTGARLQRARPSAKNYYISVGSRQVQRSWVSIRIGPPLGTKFAGGKSDLFPGSIATDYLGQ